MRKPFVVVASMTLVLAVALGGCKLVTSEEATTEENVPADVDLNGELGGMTTGDESPAFGDPDLASEFIEDAQALDPMATNSEVVGFEADSSVSIYRVQITWGTMDSESEIVTPTDWSGSLSVEKGAIVALRTILFERRDYLVRPRMDRRVLRWHSVTQNHYDGVLVSVIDPPVDPRAPGVTENTMTFSTPAYQMSLPVSSLAELDTLITVDQLGNRLHIVSFSVETGDCRHGFARGHWMQMGTDWGTMRGHWVDETGTLRGFMRGYWGRNDAGENVLFCKLIGLTGEFKGILKGTYGRGREAGSGWMRCNWISADRQTVGSFRGEWVEPGREGYMMRRMMESMGYFRGFWSEHCEDGSPGR